MIEGIRLPKHIASFEEIYSNNLDQINFETYKIDNEGMYSLDLLRDVYKKDPQTFHYIKNELFLRGFEIISASKSPLLYQDFKANSIYPMIKVDKAGKNYENIDFDKYTIKNFIKKFKIDDDLFFDGICLKNFKVFNKNLKISLLEKEFERAGFEIIYSDDQAMASISDDDHQKRTNEVNVSETQGPYEEIEQILSSLSADAKNLHPTEVFDENKFNLFREYCKKNIILSLSEITADHLIDFKNSKGVGPTKFESVLSRLADFKDENMPATDSVIHVPADKRGKLLIKDYFQNIEFNLFNLYCKRNGLTYLEDIDQEFLEYFYKRPAVNSRREKHLKNRIKSINDELGREAKDEVFTDIEFTKDIGEVSVNDLLRLIDSDIYLDSHLKLDDIRGKAITSLGLNHREESALVNLSKVIESYINPSQILNDFILRLDERDKDIIDRRFLQGQTLEEIGSSYSVSRERIRQIQNKIISGFKKYLNEKNFLLNLKLYMLSSDLADREVIRYDEFYDLIDNERYLLQLIIDESGYFEIDPKYELIFLNDEAFELITVELNKIEESLPSLINNKDLDLYFTSRIFSQGLIDIKEFLLKNDFEKNGNVWTKERLTRVEIILDYIAEETNGILYLSEDNFSEFLDKVNSKYGLDLSWTYRNIYTVLQDSSQVIKIGTNKYKKFEESDYDLKALDKYMTYMTSKLNERGVINIAEVFGHFREELISQGIDNKLYLYNILKTFYDGDAIFGKGNTLNIYLKEENVIAETTLLENFLKKNDNLATYKEIKEEFKWPQVKVDRISASSDNIVAWGDSSLKLLEKNVNKDFIEEARNLLVSLFDDYGYTSQPLFFQYAQFNDLIYDYMDSLNLTTSYQLRSLLRPYIEELKGNDLLILPLDSPYEGIYDLIREEFDSDVYYDKLYNFLTNSLQYSAGMADKTISELLEAQRYIEIDTRHYIPSELLDISNDTIAEVIDFIENEFNDYGYLSLTNLSGYTRSLKPIKVDWSKHILKHILVNNGYRMVEAFNSSYKQDMMIIVRADSDIYELDQLVYKLLKGYEGSLFEAEVVNFLVEMDVLSPNKLDSDKLPVSVYKKSELINLTDLGYVEIKD